MAIAPPHSCLHDEEEQMQIMSLKNEDPMMVESDADTDDDDAGLEEDFKALRARVAALQDEDDVLSHESWEWAEGVEALAQRAAETIAQEEEAIHRALASSVLSHMPGQDEALRAEATRLGARRADAEEITAATRRLMETDLRRLAADAETGAYSYILTLTHEELTAVVARMEIAAVGMEQWMASLAARLTRGAAEFADRPGEEAFVAAMRKEAAKADDARSAIAQYLAAAAASSAGVQMEQDY